MSRTDILTVAGRRFDFTMPEACNFGIDEIAHALSNICRFTGHTREFYSVAQHSVAVSDLVPPEFALEGLLHDAAEAFLGDVAKPLKNLLPDYQRLEQQIEAVIFARFNVQLPLPPCIKHADLVMLATEKRDLMPHDDMAWPHESLPLIAPLPKRIEPWSPNYARTSFIMRFWECVRLRPQGLRA